VERWYWHGMAARLKLTVVATLVAGVTFAGAFAIARAAGGDGDAARRAAPVYYGPPPSIPNLEASIHTPVDPGAVRAPAP
jgi:hypothetical protein